MKNCIVKFLIVLFAIACNMNVIAKDYGSDKTASDIRYFVTAGTANVYNDTSTQAKRVRKSEKKATDTIKGEEKEKNIVPVISVSDPNGNVIVSLNNRFTAEKLGSYTISYEFKDGAC